MEKTIGKLEKVELRYYWGNEATDFTPWLAQEENIAQLGDAIGIDLEVRGQEQNVGPFRADILCTDQEDHFVLIENQLEITDHKHLGQIMTYAAGLNAVSIIWIASQFTDEHRAALDWLNRVTDDGINFFGIEIQLIKIGDSAAAPLFNIVAKPNDWTKRAKAAPTTEGLSSTKLAQQQYWEGFASYAKAHNAKFKTQSPLPQHWTNFGIGRSGFWLSARVNSLEKIIAVDLNIGTSTKEYFDKLKADYESNAASEISSDLVWNRLDDKKVSLVTLTAKYDFMDEKTRNEQYAWLCDVVYKFICFFKPKIKIL